MPARCLKDQVEEALYRQRQDLFSGLDLVFFDTTSNSFEGEGGEALGRHGHSKDHRPDLKQTVVGMILDGEGHPGSCEMRPGNTTDVTTLIPVVDRLKKRFGIVRICVVADRGMISEKTREALEERKLEYILGARMRKQKEVTATVPAQAGRCHETTPERMKTKDPSLLKVKEVRVTDEDSERRYVICRNEEEARKDAHDREAIVTSLREARRRGEKRGSAARLDAGAPLWFSRPWRQAPALPCRRANDSRATRRWSAVRRPTAPKRSRFGQSSSWARFSSERRPRTGSPAASFWPKTDTATARPSRMASQRGASRTSLNSWPPPPSALRARAPRLPLPAWKGDDRPISSLEMKPTSPFRSGHWRGESGVRDFGP